jgi:ergothioneine biosynthesis protein EgtB
MATIQTTTVPPAAENPTQQPALVRERFEAVRAFSSCLCEPLEIEDYGLQSMPDASPAKWHLAHCTWFFETFVLKHHVPGYQPVHPAFEYLFNSYYNGVGPQFLRPHRGFLSRPTVREVHAYRDQVDGAMRALLSRSQDPKVLGLTELGLHHEQQHQELLLTDLKHGLSMNPLFPVYREAILDSARETPTGWVEFDEGIREIGHDSPAFRYDNEGPRHKAYLHPYALADRLVTNAEYAAFIEDGGYERPDHWLSEGYATVQAEGWKAPLYWHRIDGQWHHFTLAGLRPIEPHEPVCHVSHFEADAYANWTGFRLPTEFEWEAAATQEPVAGNFVEEGRYHPAAAQASNGSLRQLFGDAWEWTRSAYLPYPGYRAEPGALGEYNGKFMSNQMVLRGGSCATSVSHIRASYRNFFPSAARWQFTGIRIAKDI